MTPRTTSATTASRPVDAYRCTGSSPGRTGRTFARLEGGAGVRLDVPVSYELHGPAHAQAIVVLGGISAGRHLAPTPANPSRGWWPGVIGRGAALDPDRHRLVGMDYVCGPANRSTSGAAESPFDRPVTTTDQARAIAAVLDDIGVEQCAVIGASYGGMVALAFGLLFPRRAGRLLVLCAAHRSHPMATALRSIQRRAVRFAQAVGRPQEGLSLARGLAMTTYRTAIEFEARFSHRSTRDASSPRFPVEDYLEARGADFAARFDADSFIRLSESIDLHSIDPRDLSVPTTVLSVESDELVPPWLVDELAANAPGVVDHVTSSSVFGHDAFLKEIELVSRMIVGVVETQAVPR